jgi:hypothetical protein
MGQLLSREVLLSKEVLKIEKVDLGNDDYVYVTQMTGQESDNYSQSLIKKIRDKKGTVIGYEQETEALNAKLAVCTVCDDKGVLIFLPTDWNVLSQNISALKLDQIADAARKLNALNNESKEALVKNLEPDPENNSNSGSVVN